MMRRGHNRPARYVELLGAYNGVLQTSTGASSMQWREFPVASWEGAGPYTYDLVHNKARYTLPIRLYDKVTNEYINERNFKMAPKSGAELTTVVITLSWQPAANRIVIGYG